MRKRLALILLSCVLFVAATAQQPTDNFLFADNPGVIACCLKSKRIVRPLLRVLAYRELAKQ